MVLTQTSIFDRVDTLEPAIHAKIDWLSVVYSHVRTSDVLKTIFGTDIDWCDVDKAYSNRFIHSYGYITDLFISINGVNLGYHLSDVEDLLLQAQDDSFSFLDAHVDYLRLDISGQGLDYLRSIGFDVDFNFRSREWLSGSPYGLDLQYHITRCDTAFDLINYMPDFLDRQIHICRRCGNADTLRIGVVGKGGGLAYSIREGDQKTLYLGTGRSDRVLRIYDKLLQFRKGGKLGECPYNVETADGVLTPSSWIRIELQCRRPQACEEIMFGSDNFCDVFFFIKKHFALRNELNKLDWSWEQLFDWDICQEIIQNTKSVQFESVIERAEKWIENVAMSNILTYVAHHGWDALISMGNKLLLKLQTSSDPIVQRRWCALLSRLSSDLTLPPHVHSDMGLLFLD